MPGTHPWLDTEAPAQVIFTTGAPAVTNDNTQVVDTTLHFKLAGTILVALVVVFALQKAGFRFVVAAGAGR